MSKWTFPDAALDTVRQGLLRSPGARAKIGPGSINDHSKTLQDGITQFDLLAEYLAHICELLEASGIQTAQAYVWAVQAAEWLDLAIEGYEERQ